MMKSAATRAAATRGTAAKRNDAEASASLAFAHESAFAAWLASNHGSSPGLWIKMAKKGSGTPSITYAEALVVALAWGWIDGQRRSLDQGFYLQRFTRRTPRSIWSKINREKALAMIAAGNMKPPGLAEVERAQRDGRWEAAYDGQRTSSIPADLAAALAANRRAAAFFAGLDSKNRYAVLFRIHGAKKAETRARRIATFVAMLARHEKVHNPA
jgi:uncharacterized protein YdeI (YjbR/CyaY-like superfamily)